MYFAYEMEYIMYLCLLVSEVSTLYNRTDQNLNDRKAYFLHNYRSSLSVRYLFAAYMLRYPFFHANIFWQKCLTILSCSVMKFSTRAVNLVGVMIRVHNTA